MRQRLLDENYWSSCQIVFFFVTKHVLKSLTTPISLHSGVKRPLLQLSSGAWEWIPRERVYNPKIPPNPAFIWSSRVLGEIHPYVLSLENVLFFYLPSSNRVLNCIYVAVQTKKPWDIYENYKSVSGWTVWLNSHRFTRDLRHTMWLNCCDLADFCGIKMQRYETGVLFMQCNKRQMSEKFDLK